MVTARYILNSLPLRSSAYQPYWALRAESFPSNRASMVLMPAPEPTPIYDALYDEVALERDEWMAWQRMAKSVNDLGKAIRDRQCALWEERKRLGVKPGESLLERLGEHGGFRVTD
jgi:hypothetical protein